MNADTHPFYKRFHKPGDEKRMPIFLTRDEYMPWLTAAVEDAPVFFKPYPGPLLCEAAPLAKAPKVVGNPSPKEADKSEKMPKLLQPKTPSPSSPPSSPMPPVQGDLF